MTTTDTQTTSESSSSRDLVLYHLGREKGLTVHQTAILSGITRPAAQRLLARMEQDGLVKKAPEVVPNFYHLPTVKAYNIFNSKHEKIAGDIYVYLQELIEFWDWKEYQDFTRFKLKPDRSSVIKGKVLFWEIDRSTMVKKRIIEKIEKYLSYARANNRKFNVVFVASKRRAASIAQEFGSYRNPFVWFAAVDVDQLLQNPLGNIFQTLDNRVLSIEELM